MRVSRMLGMGIALLGLGSLNVPASAVVPFEATVVQAWGVNGTVHATAIVGDTVVVGGTFTRAVSPQGTSVDRVNLAAFSLSTGELLTGWRADTNGTVRALGTDGTSVWVGGDFTAVGGMPSQSLAKLDAGTAAVDPGFSASVNGAVRTVEVGGGDLYIGGAFGAVNGVSRGRIAKLDADHRGSRLPVRGTSRQAGLRARATPRPAPTGPCSCPECSPCSMPPPGWASAVSMPSPARCPVRLLQAPVCRSTDSM